MAFSAKSFALVGTLCLIGAVLTLLPGVRQNQQHSTLDVRTTNRQKAELADVDGLHVLALDVYNHSSSMRWGIFGFNADRTTVQPIAYGSKTWDWLGDFQTFMDSFPEDDVAYGVYDFEYWMSSSKCKELTGTMGPCFGSRSVFFTWAPNDIEPRDLALGGYFLSAVLVASEGFGQVAALSTVDHEIGYIGVCDKLLLEGSQCHVADSFANGDCPFDDPSGRNPCNQQQCRGTQLIPNGIPEPCCTYIHEYCMAMDEEDKVQGCHEVSLHFLEQSCADPLHPETPHISHDVHFALCSPKCVDRECIFFEGVESWKFCNSCTEAEGAKCFPGAVDFVQFNCCATNEETARSGLCDSEEYQNQVGCGMVKEKGCGFMKTSECPAFDIAETVGEAEADDEVEPMVEEPAENPATEE